jgi:hemoglobin-like flavoprotein
MPDPRRGRDRRLPMAPDRILTVTASPETPMPDAADLIADTWNQLAASEEIADRFALTFYALLFDTAPGVRHLFPAGMAAQRAKLLAVLSMVVRSATDPDFDHDTHQAKLRHLGAGHRGFGAEPVHYPVVGTALLKAMEWTVEGWTLEHAETWGAAYQGVADVMIAAAEKAAAETPEPYQDTELVATEWTPASTRLAVAAELPDGRVVVSSPETGNGWVRATVVDGVIVLDTGGDDLDALVLAALPAGASLRVAPDETETTR